VSERNGTPPPRSSSPRASAHLPSQASRRSEGVIHQAAAVLRDEHQVTDMVAFEMLVRGAADAGTSVRELAHAVLEGDPSPVVRVSPDFLDEFSASPSRSN
jgi:hypothetical protein